MPSIVSETKRLGRLERYYTDLYRDIAVRLKVKGSGELGALHGGRWHVRERRYLEPWELYAQAAMARTDEERVAAPLRVHTIEVSAPQFQLAEDLATPFVMGNGSRRGGKSFGSAVKAEVCIASRPGLDGELVSPTFRKSRIMQRYVADLLPDEWIKDTHRQERWVETWNGVRVTYLSAHDPDSLVGEGVGWIGFDEAQNISEEAWGLAMPAASDGGSAFQIWQCGTPRMGPYRQRYERFRVMERAGNARIIHFTYRDNPFIETGDGTIFELAGQAMDPRRRRQELDAEFVAEEGLVYYAFDREKHCKNWRLLQRGKAWADDITEDYLARELEPMFPCRYVIGIDWGIGRQFAVVYRIVRVGGHTCLWAVAEVALEKDADVDDLALELVDRGFYPAAVFPDPTGLKSRGLGNANLRLEAFTVAGRRIFDVYAPAKSRSVADRVDAVNAMMFNGQKQVRWFVDPDECPRLVESIENQELDNGRPRRSKPNETSYHDLPDAAGYPVIMLFSAKVDFELAEKRAA